MMVGILLGFPCEFSINFELDLIISQYLIFFLNGKNNIYIYIYNTIPSFNRREYHPMILLFYQLLFVHFICF
jgi:hypothetical protein